MNGSAHQLRQTQVHVSALMNNGVSGPISRCLQGDQLTPSVQGYEFQGSTEVPEMVKLSVNIKSII
jgi:hypothetical protein